MRPITQFIIACGAVFAASNLLAAQLQPIVENQQLGFLLSDVAWPTTLTKDFSSGFENKILIRVFAVSSGKPITQADIVVVEKYDLWDEVFSVKLLVAGLTKSQKTFKHVEDAITHLGKLNVTNIFVLNTLQQSQELTLQADILVNPVEREKMERLNQWVAENSTPRLPGQGAAALTAKPNSLFNKIYDQYVHGADMSAPWKATVLSRQFNVQELQMEPRGNE